MPTSDALLRTDSLSGTDPALSDGSVGSAPSLGLSPGTPGVPDMNRPLDKNKSKNQDVREISMFFPSQIYLISYL